MPGILSTADRIALRDLVDAYAAAADGGDAALLVSLFTADATMAVRQRGTDVPLRLLEGTEQIGTLLEGLEPFEETQHLMVNQHVQAGAEGGATGQVDGIAHHLLDRGTGTEDLVMHLRYEDEYVRDGDRWRFAGRDLRIRWAAWTALEQEPLAV
jgi:hypothetical protein